ncbi:hypothetical protein NDU88_004093 [Pleurodeles waltl]|uniref:Uncharacterized protein n=1 Tax=Pleurodeles waltl TaxID=8319 RepID=A0AAV7UG70_PLEWA|nr:hypothetical protein NDU88_004093 [Pleurodeles waltl]
MRAQSRAEAARVKDDAMGAAKQCRNHLGEVKAMQTAKQAEATRLKLLRCKWQSSPEGVWVKSKSYEASVTMRITAIGLPAVFVKTMALSIKASKLNAAVVSRYTGRFSQGAE